MSCDNNNYGYGGGCGCQGTVQYAPPACNPNFPTSCTALGTGTIQRVVGEDSSSCKYTVAPLLSNSLLFYNASTALVTWGNGTTANPLFIGNGTGQATASASCQLQATTPTGQLVVFAPSVSTETQFPIVSPSGVTTNWGTIENIVPNQGLVYKNSSNIVAQAPLGTTGQVLTMSNAIPSIPVFQTPTTPSFIDAQAINLYYASASTINVTFGSLVLNSFGSNPKIVANGSSSTYTLSINSIGVGAMDVSATSASTYYYVYAIYNPTTSAFNVVGSTSYISPTATNISGYTYYRLIGMFYTGAGNVISSGYYQNGRVVYLGNTNYVPIFTSSTTSILYWSGSITTFAPYQVANKANILLSSLVQPANQSVSVQIANNAANASGVNANYWLAPTSEIYGSASLGNYGMPASSSTYLNFDCVISQLSTSYYNINLGIVQGTSSGVKTSLVITGYNLSIF